MFILVFIICSTLVFVFGVHKHSDCEIAFASIENILPDVFTLKTQLPINVFVMKRESRMIMTAKT